MRRIRKKKKKRDRDTLGLTKGGGRKEGLREKVVVVVIQKREKRLSKILPSSKMTERGKWA